MFVTHLRTVTMRAVLASSLFLALLALHASRVDAFEGPTIDEETMVEVAKACIADEEGLCGETCFGSVRDAALVRAGDFEVPCGDGLDSVMDALKGCMGEQGLEFDDCGGKTTDASASTPTRSSARAGPSRISCEGSSSLPSLPRSFRRDDLASFSSHALRLGRTPRSNA